MFGLKAVEVFYSFRGASGGAKDCFWVVLKVLEPVMDVLGVIGSEVTGDAEFRAQDGASEFN